MRRPFLYIIDTTLRDGEQSPGVVISSAEKLRIAEMLDELGVDEVEAGTPAIGYDEQKAISEIAHAGFRFKTSCWCRAKTEDILQAAKLGTQSVNISLPVSDIQIETLGKTRAWVLQEAKKMVSLARQHFSFVTLGAQDATRSDSNFLKEFIFYAHDSGAGRVRIADTLGCSDPFEIFSLITELKNDFPEVEFEFHGHNDLGMATANAIAAIRAGIECVSATVNGLGERAGNSALEEIIAFLNFKLNETRFKSRVIHTLSSYVACVSGTGISPNKAVTGENAFRHESGIHTSAILKNVKSYQVLNPNDFGMGNSEISFGKHSGKASIANFFREKGLPLDEQTAQAILFLVKELVTSSRKPVSGDELISIYHSMKEYMKTVSDNDFKLNI